MTAGARRTMHVDVAVIGGGPGGYASAIRAAQLGRNVVLVEKEKLGGVCLNWGCIPSKALIHAADVLGTVRNASAYGISFDNLTLDFPKAMARSRTVVDKQTRGLQFLMRKNGIAVQEGTATFADSHTLHVTAPDGARTEIAADAFVIATGGRARELPNLPYDGRHVISSREAVVLSALPERAVIVGGGAIGVEFAYIWHAYGVDVTLVEYEERLLPLEDADVSAELTRQFRGRGIQVLTHSTALAFDAGGRVLQGSSRRDQGLGLEWTLPADTVLAAVGIQARTEGLGLDAIGVQVDARGFVQVDEYLRTSLPHIYAVGDCTGRLPLAHVAIAQAVTAAESLAQGEPVPLGDEQYRFMPRCTYASPQVASLGYTEEEVKRTGRACNMSKVPLFPNGKAKATGVQQGFVKIIADAAYGEILGAHMVGADVTELLPAISLAQLMELTPTEIARTVHAHPTLSEVVMEAAAAVEGTPLHL